MRPLETLRSDRGGRIAAGLAALIGLSRIYLGMHYPSDVAAGYAVAVVWLAAIDVAARRLAPVPPARSRWSLTTWYR